jgi:hypothetical protein
MREAFRREMEAAAIVGRHFANRFEGEREVYVVRTKSCI